MIGARCFMMSARARTFDAAKWAYRTANGDPRWIEQQVPLAAENTSVVLEECDGRNIHMTGTNGISRSLGISTGTTQAAAAEREASKLMSAMRMFLANVDFTQMTRNGSTIRVAFANAAKLQKGTEALEDLRGLTRDGSRYTSKANADVQVELVVGGAQSGGQRIDIADGISMVVPPGFDASDVVIIDGGSLDNRSSFKVLDRSGSAPIGRGGNRQGPEVALGITARQILSGRRLSPEMVAALEQRGIAAGTATFQTGLGEFASAVSKSKRIAKTARDGELVVRTEGLYAPGYFGMGIKGTGYDFSVSRETGLPMGKI